MQAEKFLDKMLDTNQECAPSARILKHLAAMGTIYEVDIDRFQSTKLSEALIKPVYRDGFPILYEPIHGLRYPLLFSADSIICE